MANVCIICNHRDRLAIDRSIVEGLNLAKIAKDHGVPYYSIYQHSQKHVSRQLLAVADKKLVIEGDELMEIITKNLKRSERIFRRNYDKGNDLLALKSLDSSRNTIQLLNNIVAQVHSAKMAELQLQKDTGTDRQAQLQQEYQEKISILSLEELSVHGRLVNKITNQNNDKIISKGKVLEYNCNIKKSD